jgi:hypothetical protein
MKFKPDWIDQDMDFNNIQDFCLFDCGDFTQENQDD